MRTGRSERRRNACASAVDWRSRPEIKDVKVDVKRGKRKEDRMS